MLIAFASASEAMMKCVPLSKIAVVALSPGRGFAAALPTLMPVRFTDQYFCTAAQLWEGCLQGCLSLMRRMCGASNVRLRGLHERLPNSVGEHQRRELTLMSLGLTTHPGTFCAVP